MLFTRTKDDCLQRKWFVWGEFVEIVQLIIEMDNLLVKNIILTNRRKKGKIITVRLFYSIL